MKKFSTKLKAILVVASVIAMVRPIAVAQDSDSTSKVEFSANVDLYSRYIWRGAQFGSAPSIQPTVKMVAKNLTIGYWGAYQFDGFAPESDLYISYALPKGFGLTLTDYFISPADLAIADYTDFSDTSTCHTMEGMLTFTGPEKFPLSVLFGYNFFGLDAYKGSMYGELSYPIKNFTLIVGAGNEMYTGKTESDWGVVNAGFKVSRSIEVTDKFSLPVTGQIMFNPTSKKLLYTVGFSF